MTMHHSALAEIARRDPRYPYEAYEFVYAALAYTQKQLHRSPGDNVSGPELLEGVRQLALREFGLMARTVFRLWGINRTDDIGEIMFNLVAESLMDKADTDRRDDFHERYDLDQALVHDYRIQLDEAEWKA
jgi:uncharacterized repeat protein (TIGR04138 family)